MSTNKGYWLEKRKEQALNASKCGGKYWTMTKHHDDLNSITTSIHSKLLRSCLLPLSSQHQHYSFRITIENGGIFHLPRRFLDVT